MPTLPAEYITIEAVLEAHLETSKNIVDRGNPLACGTDSHSGVARDGFE